MSEEKKTKFPSEVNLEALNSSGESYFASLSHTSLDSAGSNPRYWTKISVRLASCLRDRFNSLRILIVCEDSDKFSGVVLHDYLDPSNIRLSLSRQRQSADLMPSRTITVVFEQTAYFNTRTVGHYNLSLRTPRTKANELPLRTLYDRILPIDPVSIGACVRLQNTSPLPPGCRMSRYENRMFQVRNILIIPVIRATPMPSREFPPEVLRRIVIMTLGDTTFGTHPDTWAETVLSLALVQKSWLSVRTLFWDLAFGNFPGYFVRDPVGVASSLEAQPHLGKTRLKYIDCESMDDNQPHFVQSMARILANAGNSLKYLSINYPTFAASSTSLATLEHVETFRIGIPAISHDKAPLSVLSKVQKVLEAWKMLRTLIFHAPVISRENVLVHEDSAKFTPPYLLRHLELVNVPIFPGQLLHFFSKPAPQCLRRLRLVAVSGLSNKTLTDVLLLVASTLEELEISKSIISRPEEGMEHALDVASPNMVALRRAEVDSSIATALSIMRIPASNSSMRRYLIMAVADLSQFFPPGLWLAEAIQQSNWTDITFDYVITPLYMEAPKLFQERLKLAHEVARARRISLITYPITLFS